jgi:integrase
VDSKLRARFERSVDRTGEHHLWTGATDPGRGTGKIKVEGKTTTAHRVAWLLEHGSPPPGVRIFPCEEEPACVRVDHLRIDSRLEPVRTRARSRKGSGTMRQVSPGKWKLTVTTPSGGADPRRVHKTVTARNATQATAELARFASEVRSAPVTATRDDSRLDFDAAVERFLTEHLLEERGREEKTVRDYRSLHQLWFSPELGRRLVRDVDRAAIDRLFGRMQRAGLSRSRMNQAKSLYAPFFRWAISRGLAGANPMTEFQLPTSRHVASEKTPPEVDELSALLSAAVEVVPEIAPLLVLGAVTGMRRGELVGIRRSRINWKACKITVDIAMDGRRVKATKTRKERTIHVDDETLAMLARVCEQIDIDSVTANTQSVIDPFVFTIEPDGSRPMTPDFVTKRVAVLKEHLGIESKAPATIERETEALRLWRQSGSDRQGRTGPAPSGGLSYREIGMRLGRSERWAAMAVASALRREAAAAEGRELDFDGSILALRKFTSSELLDAGFNIGMVAHRQGHGPQVLAKHYAKSRRSSDRLAAEHLGSVVHRKSTG